MGPGRVAQAPPASVKTLKLVSRAPQLSKSDDLSCAFPTAGKRLLKQRCSLGSGIRGKSLDCALVAVSLATQQRAEVLGCSTWLQRRLQHHASPSSRSQNCKSTCRTDTTDMAETADIHRKRLGFACRRTSPWKQSLLCQSCVPLWTPSLWTRTQLRLPGVCPQCNVSGVSEHCTSRRCCCLWRRFLMALSVAVEAEQEKEQLRTAAGTFGVRRYMDRRRRLSFRCRWQCGGATGSQLVACSQRRGLSARRSFLLMFSRATI